MTPESFTRWLAEMKSAGRIKTDKEAAALLGISPNSVVTMKRDGVQGPAETRTALACRALLAGLAPYGEDTPDGRS